MHFFLSKSLQNKKHCSEKSFLLVLLVLSVQNEIKDPVERESISREEQMQ